jgi:hypothetical protein
MRIVFILQMLFYFSVLHAETKIQLFKDTVLLKEEKIGKVYSSNNFTWAISADSSKLWRIDSANTIVDLTPTIRLYTLAKFSAFYSSGGNDLWIGTWGDFVLHYYNDTVDQYQPTYINSEGDTLFKPNVVDSNKFVNSFLNYWGIFKAGTELFSFIINNNLFIPEDTLTNGVRYFNNNSAYKKFRYSSGIALQGYTYGYNYSYFADLKPITALFDFGSYIWHIGTSSGITYSGNISKYSLIDHIITSIYDSFVATNKGLYYVDGINKDTLISKLLIKDIKVNDLTLSNNLPYAWLATDSGIKKYRYFNLSYHSTICPFENTYYFYMPIVNLVPIHSIL